ncbi:MAG: zf-HC2 domain-containing protein [Vicinamibacteria bacterium]|nr:zf-HC2 domain-containing protein [Vicinamibacteria bacterium]
MTRYVPCREFVEFLDDYLSSRLPAEERALFNEHLSRCPPCVAYMQGYEAARSLGRRVLERTDDPLPHSVPESLVQAILAARRRSHPA